ncbi:hypothetical protein NQ318_003668 [Aromia moschata]|uniref:Uncharacterized protein n=1 Tax=Aromia moschata TaxID=1265417 RepID=A0AAV8X2M9_9CUCU|nr:hypothetical protein NQ318_003668 [Aromia moschata]
MATKKIILYDSEKRYVFWVKLMFLQQMLNVRPQFIFNSHLYIFPYLLLIHIFVTELLKRVISQEPQSSTSTNVDYENYDCDNDGTNGDFINEEDTVCVYTGGVHPVYYYYWKHIGLWKEPSIVGNCRKKGVGRITKELTEKGYNVTGPQCSYKL